jgi:hypothetical protein
MTEKIDKFKAAIKQEPSPELVRERPRASIWPKLRRLFLLHCLASYLAFAVFFTLAIFWWPRVEWMHLASALPWYALGAPITMPALVVAPIIYAPGPGLHAVLLWVVCLVSILLTHRFVRRFNPFSSTNVETSRGDANR